MTERRASLVRTTRESDIHVDLNLDGSGKFDVECDIQFLKHMVETLARYSSVDIRMTATGDNDHHLIEDVAITLGTAFRQAIGDVPIERMATFTIPMDDALVMASIDLVDRPFAEVDCQDVLYHHFFRSFSMSLRCTLHIMQVRGYDEHHLVEASFKALGRALKDALKIRESELSTKDSVKVKKC